MVTGESLLLRSRPDFAWDDVKSAATRLFAEHSGHKALVCDTGLPLFAQLWPTHVVPFMQRAAGFTGKVVLIAHNGDRFDHYVLSKEINRLGLDIRCCPTLISADPVATLKLGRLLSSGFFYVLNATVLAIQVKESAEGCAFDPLSISMLTLA